MDSAARSVKAVEPWWPRQLRERRRHRLRWQRRHRSYPALNSVGPTEMQRWGSINRTWQVLSGAHAAKVSIVSKVSGSSWTSSAYDWEPSGRDDHVDRKFAVAVARLGGF